MTNSKFYTRAVFAFILSTTSFMASATESINPWNNNTCNMPEYDSKMLRGEEKGVVKLRFTTDTNGNVIDAAIEESSGFSNLDRASMSALKGCRFTMANHNSKPETTGTPEKRESRLISFNWAIK
ncbi:energy transducer TonB [Undibacterium seohonense]|uniref:Energy transducer TonB n=1 Tax=Undibacterium seohonense TaxID=1344950 RepID=A0ABR6X3P6_9BURK|nr:energy transducer TonB [Undibacterium seohonense]MBC3807562.1 energy transducer TonB [Undibacterium seohonense]